MESLAEEAEHVQFFLLIFSLTFVCPQGTRHRLALLCGCPALPLMRKVSSIPVWNIR